MTLKEIHDCQITGGHAPELQLSVLAEARKKSDLTAEGVRGRRVSCVLRTTHRSLKIAHEGNKEKKTEPPVPSFF